MADPEWIFSDSAFIYSVEKFRDLKVRYTYLEDSRMFLMLTRNHGLTRGVHHFPPLLFWLSGRQVMLEKAQGKAEKSNTLASHQHFPQLVILTLRVPPP